MLEYLILFLGGSGTKGGREALASSERGCGRESWGPGGEHKHRQSVIHLGWKEEPSSFFLECPESHPRGLPRPLAGSEKQFHGLQSNVLFNLQVTINSQIKLRVYVHKQAPELLELLMAVHLGNSSPREEGTPFHPPTTLASCRPGPNPKSPRVGNSGGLIPPSLAADPSGCGEGWGRGGGFGAVEVI